MDGRALCRLPLPVGSPRADRCAECDAMQHDAPTSRRAAPRLCDGASARASKQARERSQHKCRMARSALVCAGGARYTALQRGATRPGLGAQVCEARAQL